MAGGSGIDTVTYAARATGVTVTMDGVFDDGEPGEADNVAADIENAVGGAGDNTLIGSASANNLVGAAGVDTIDGAAGDDTLTSSSGADRLTGGAGNDTVSSGDGSDTVLEGAGNDSLDAGAGSDTLDYSGVAAAVTLTLASPFPQNTVGAGTDTVVAFENLAGGTGADTLAGDGNANVISGNAGNDTISGDGGDDTISGDLGTDTLDYSSLVGDVIVVLAPATDTTPGLASGAAGTDSLLGIENVSGGARERLPYG